MFGTRLVPDVPEDDVGLLRLRCPNVEAHLGIEHTDEFVELLDREVVKLRVVALTSDIG